MTQEPNRQSSNYKRPTRSTRKRPVLVTSNSTTPVDGETSDLPQEEMNTDQAVEETSPVEAPAPRARRLPGFFSSVKKNEQASEPNETEQAQARIARATRGKPAQATTKSTDTSKQPEGKAPAKVSTPTSARQTPARQSGFKFRYIYGMILYLVIADFVGIIEANFLHANKLEYRLAQFGPIAINTSTLVFLATLVIILVVLAYFDLIPRNLGAAMGGQSAQRKPGQSQATSSGTAGAKIQPPVMKQGVQGADDDLYQEYRAQQRRARKK